MASILSNSQSQALEQQNQAGAVSNLIGEILDCGDPQASFNQLLSTNPEAQNAMNLINQYGNGNPRTAFMNYMGTAGRQSLGQKIMQFFGLV